MKTKLTLTILGTYNTIVGIMMIAIPSSMAAMMVNSDNIEVLRMGELMHYGLSPAILIIGLMLLFTRNSSIGTAKNILLAYLIGTLVLMYTFFGVFSDEILLNFTFLEAIPDLVMLVICIVGYIKAKQILKITIYIQCSSKIYLTLLNFFDHLSMFACLMKV